MWSRGGRYTYGRNPDQEDGTRTLRFIKMADKATWRRDGDEGYDQLL